ncbi:hypothetical protein [Caballeronia sp. KNU42]
MEGGRGAADAMAEHFAQNFNYPDRFKACANQPHVERDKSNFLPAVIWRLSLGERDLENPSSQNLVRVWPSLSLDQIIVHPQFSDARKHYIDSLLAVYDEPFLARLLIESGRFFVHKLIILLNAAQEDGLPDTWLTIGRLKQEMQQFGFASERQIDHLVQRLISVDFLEQVPTAQDRRVRILKPTEKMLAHDRAWLVAHYVPLTILCPQNDYSLAMRGDPVFQIALSKMSVRILPMVAQLMATVPDMLLFFDFAAGQLILAALLQAALSEPESQYVRISYSSIAERFGVSRTHVRKLLSAAHVNGLVQLHIVGGNAVEILPRLWASYDRSIAIGMHLHNEAYAIVTGNAVAP